MMDRDFGLLMIDQEGHPRDVNLFQVGLLTEPVYDDEPLAVLQCNERVVPGIAAVVNSLAPCREECPIAAEIARVAANDNDPRTILQRIENLAA